MGVNLCGIQVIMTQNLLDGPDVHSILQHQRGGGVAQFMGRVFTFVQSSGREPLFYHGVDRGTADPLVAGG